MLLEPPKHLPVAHLSNSSLRLFKACPEKWRRRYIEHEYEQPTGNQIVGSAVHAAARDSYSLQVDTGQRMSEADLLDAYADAWALEFERVTDLGMGVDWGDEKPGRVKDSGARVLPVYHRHVAPTVQPIAVEREFTVHLPDVDWTYVGFIDVEAADEIPDLKIRAPSSGIIRPADALSDIQPTGTLFALRAEGTPKSRFAFHNLVRVREPGPKHVLITPTERTDAQLDAFLGFLYSVAAEIHWRVTYDVWTGPAPGAWQCTPEYCGYWHDCGFGGKFAAALLAPRPARKPSASAVRRAVAATTSKRDGNTTAHKVAAHLGISPREAAAVLRAEVRAGRVLSVPPTKAFGRGKQRVVKTVSGPRRYALSPDRQEAIAA